MNFRRYWKAIGGLVAGGIATGAAIYTNADPETITATTATLQTAIGAIVGALGPLIFPKNSD